MAFPDSWMQELLYKNDLAGLVSEYAKLVPRGGKLWACCPFHREKTPSFTVDATRQLFYCFGCHKGGSVVQFVKEIENLPSNFEAIKFLAQRAGMDLPNDADSEEIRRERALRDRLCNASRDAARFFHEQLKSSPEAVNYFVKRGLTPKIINKFGLGYSPNEWDALYKHLTELGYSFDELYRAGLVRASNKNNRPFDFFRNRVMFPIISENGTVIGFGGRTMGADEPKYLNTGETAVYNKRNHLYALYTCNKQRLSDLIIVEGYMDVIAMHSAGITNAVASLGTALTKQQAMLIKRRVSTVYISYDGDSAGQNATLRGLDILAETGLNVRVIVIPDGNDPDEYIKLHGADAYLTLKDNALTLNSYKIERMAASHDLDSADGRQTFAKEACKLISTFEPVEKERYYDVVARKTGITAQTLRAQGDISAKERRVSEEKAMPYRENRGRISYTEREKCELTVAACAMADAEAMKIALEVARPLMTDDKTKALLDLFAAEYEKRGAVDVAFVSADNDEQAAKLSELRSEFDINNPSDTIRDCVSRLKKLYTEDALRTLAAEYDSGIISKEAYLEKLNYLRISDSG